MARYSKTLWNTNTIYNPTNMNHIEQGIYDADLREGGTINGDIYLDRQNGTSSTEGYTYLSVGNDIPVGTDKNSTGLIRIYADNGNRTNIYSSATGNRSVGFPDKSGTIALTSDVDGTTIDVDPITSSGNPRSTNIVNKSRISGKQVIVNVTFTSAITASNSPGMVYIKSNTPKILSALSCVRLASNGDIEAVVGAYSLVNGTIYVKEVVNGANYVLTGCYAID